MTRPRDGAIFGIVLFASVLTGVLFGAASPVAASTLPNAHDMFANNDSICVTCHRTHTALNEQLLRSDAGMCLTCHQNGIAADTDVWNGIFAEVPNSDNLNWGETGGTLLGGGFNRVGGAVGTAATSAHTMDIDAIPAGSDSGASVRLVCTSCHNIHHNFLMPAQYRLLRSRPGDATADIAVPWNGPWEGPAQTTPRSPIGYMAYTERIFGNDLAFTPPGSYTGDPKEFTRNYQAGIAAWCSGCHTRYMTRQDTTAYDAKDAAGNQIRYRHAVDVPITGRVNRFNSLITYEFQTDLPLEDKNGLGRTNDDDMTCLTCHRAHGTDAVMTGETVLVSGGDRGALPSGTDSMLLRMDDRLVCQTACHKVVSTP